MFTILFLLANVWGAAFAITPFSANLVACGSIATGCSHVLDVAVNQPFGGTDPYYVTYCSGPGYICLPVSYPVGDWVTSYVSNTGNANAGPFTVGLYLSTAVDPTTELCAVDTRYPLRDAIQLASASFTGLAQGQTLPVVFQPGNAIEYWMASQWNSGRWNMFRCLFVFANDGNTVYELQATETDNLALAPVRLLDLVDLAPSSYQVDFTAVPWLSARIYNAGLVTSPLFHVDFYQVAADPVTEACPLFTNQEYPLSLNRIEIFDAIFLGSVPVYGLEPKSYRVVFPRISQVPATDPNVTSTCILVYVDAANNVPEPQDGPANIAASDVGNADIVKFLQPPEIIIIPRAWNKFIILYAILGLLALLVVGYLWYRFRRRQEMVDLHEAQYLERQSMKEPPPPPPKEPEPVPFFQPDAEVLRKEEEEAKNNPDFDRPILVNSQSKKTGIVRDKKGNIIGTISAGGVIRDKTGRRIGVSTVGAPRVAPTDKVVLDGYFGKAV